MKFGSYDGAGQSFMPGSHMPKSVIALIVVNVAGFILTMIPGVDRFCEQWLYLDTRGFYPWQAFTYMFFHADGSHLFFNLLSLFLFGASVESQFYGRQFLAYYLSCGIGAAVLSYLFALFTPMGYVLGASGAIFGLYYACYKFFPEAVVHVWFVLPIKLKYLLLLLGGFSFLMMFDGDSNVAHVAHFGGLVTGIAWFRYADSILIMRHAWQRKREESEEMDREKVKIEVDRILEKISSLGMGSLTRKEKKFLSQASRRFKK